MDVNIEFTSAGNKQKIVNFSGLRDDLSDEDILAKFKETHGDKYASPKIVGRTAAPEDHQAEVNSQPSV